MRVVSAFVSALLSGSAVSTLGNAAAQTPTAPAAANAAPAPGMATYRSDVLHLSYSYPSDYKDASSTVGPAFAASMNHADTGAPEATRCVTLPFSAMNTDKGLSILLLVRADAGCAKKTFTASDLPVFTQGEVQGLQASGGHPQFGEPVSFTVGAHPAQMLQGSFTLPTGQAIRAMVTCVLLKPDIACFQFLGSSDENLRTMAAFPVSFDGGPAAPLLPPNVLAKPSAK